MHRITSTIALSAALSAAVLVGTAASVDVGATPIVTGHGEWDTPIGTVGFEVSAVELPDGSLQGQGLSYLHSESGNAWFHFEVIETLDLGSEIAVAGIITEVFNAPPQFLGSLTVLAIQDNDGNGTPDRAVSASGLPLSLTLEQIMFAPPPYGPPPPDFWFPLAAGNFQVH